MSGAAQARLICPASAGLFLCALSSLLVSARTAEPHLYVCPLRALLNNLEPRIQRYAAMVGRRAILWHGDVANSRRRQILREPPDILLTTPESLEAMLISTRVEHRDLFATTFDIFQFGLKTIKQTRTTSVFVF